MTKYPALTDELKKSFVICDEIMKDRAKSFYYSFKKLPFERFEGVKAVYAFCRHADDLVDSVDEEHHEDALKKLKELETAVYEISAPAKPVHHSLSDELAAARKLDWWPAFELTVEVFNLPADSFIEQIDGQRMDITGFEIKTLDDLTLYSRHVAGSVGTMLLPMLIEDDNHLTDDKLIEACRSLGVGMQFTNILRDVGEDIRDRNRIYLPEELMEEYSMTPELLSDLAHSSLDHKTVSTNIPGSFIQLWEHLSQEADSHYRQIFKYLPQFHSSCRFPLAASALVYRGIADAVRKEQYNCFTKRCYTSPQKRLALLNQARKLVKRLEKKPFSEHETVF